MCVQKMFIIDILIKSYLFYTIFYFLVHCFNIKYKYYYYYYLLNKKKIIYYTVYVYEGISFFYLFLDLLHILGNKMYTCLDLIFFT